jgi:hypothetical protein
LIADLAFALLLLGFLIISSSVGIIGFLFNSFNDFLCPHEHIKSSHIQSFVSLLNICFVALSSSEWKLITNIFPSFSSKLIASFRDVSIASSSLLTSILIA